jgi:hypothetical protein
LKVSAFIHTIFDIEYNNGKNIYFLFIYHS